ncbi:tyrosine-type recombinase/integrase [Paraburkholderia youngii]|uniref:tyrosine-type recombinase/integrase n=1 Tax=Paraburkholderia youngii TaxID=2782701 RepID=UPI003D20854D
MPSLGRDKSRRASTITPEIAVALALLEQISKTGHCAVEVDQHGYNRAPTGMCMLADAHNDVGAITAWLRNYDEVPRTRRSYTREIERFYAWLAILQNKGLASVSTHDVWDYDQFLKAPRPDWCGKRYGRRSTDDWRPFEGPLSERSRVHARAIVGTFFGWLVTVGYLVRDPFVVDRWYQRLENSGRNEMDSRTIFLSLSDFRRLAHTVQQYVDAIKPSDTRKRAEAERQLFVLRFLAYTGLRRDELGRARMCDIRLHKQGATSQSGWTMEVKRKDITRLIVLNEGALSALRRYRPALGASEHFSGNESPLLLPVWGERGRRKRFIVDQAIYDDVRAAVEIAQGMIAPEDPSFARLLSNVTPHSLRRTCAAILEQLGINPKLIQLQLGNASLDSTRNTDSVAGRSELVEAIAALRIEP